MQKTHCYKSGGECKCTSDIRHAINFENVSENRKKDKQARVKPFDPAEVARLCPIVREVIAMEEEDD